MIWALFSLDNLYDQPYHNLVGWWKDKPSLETLAKALGTTFPSAKDEEVIKVVRLWQGEDIFDGNNTRYMLRDIKEGPVTAEWPQKEKKK